MVRDGYSRKGLFGTTHHYDDKGKERAYSHKVAVW